MARFSAKASSMTEKARIVTEKGMLDVELYSDSAPRTVANFLKLARQGFYDGLTFHRVVPRFILQTGCPEGTGEGGPGYTIDCELDGAHQRHDRGVLSMAHHGRNTGGSQFFICLNRENTKDLDGDYTVFGRVIHGMDILDKIEKGDVIVTVQSAHSGAI